MSKKKSNKNSKIEISNTEIVDLLQKEGQKLEKFNEDFEKIATSPVETKTLDIKTTALKPHKKIKPKNLKKISTYKKIITSFIKYWWAYLIVVIVLIIGIIVLWLYLSKIF